jgi:hypothetical protein
MAGRYTSKKGGCTERVVLRLAKGFVFWSVPDGWVTLRYY